MPFFKKPLVLILLILLSSLLFFSALGKSSLWDIDEANNAECSREMMVRGDPIVPTFNEDLRTDKPPLIYWCMWLAYKKFNVNEFSARFFSPLFGIATVILTFLLANYLFSLSVSFLAGLILLSTLFLNISVRIATPDAALIFFINLAIFSFIIGYERRQSLYFYLFYLAMGLAVLTKGPMGIVLPLLAVFIFILLKRDFFILRKIKLIKGLLLFVLIVLPWHLLVYFKTNGVFLEGFILKHNIQRFLTPMEGHKGPIVFYLLILPFVLFPWGGILPYLFWGGYKRWQGGRLTNAEAFLWVWIGVFILFFSFAQSKLPTYINPVFPALAILIATYLNEAKPWALKCLLYFNAIFAMLFLFGAGAALAQFYPTLFWIAFFGFIPFIGWWAGIYFYHHKKIKTTIFTQFLGAYCFILAISCLAVPAIDQYKLTKPFALEIKKRIKPDTPIIAYHYFQPSLVFYTQHKIEKINDPKEIFDCFKKAPLAFIIGREKPLKELKKQIPGLRILDCRPGFYVRDSICLSQWEKRR